MVYQLPFRREKITVMLMWNGLKKETKSNMILLPSGMTEPVHKKLKLTHRYPMLVPSFVFLLCLVWDDF